VKYFVLISARIVNSCVTCYFCVFELLLIFLVVLTESGRMALMEADGIQILYSTCQETVDCRELESIISLANTIMRKCFPKNRLPVPTLRSPLSFSLPDSDAYESTTQLDEGL
jgi:hypothetical protein